LELAQMMIQSAVNAGIVPNSDQTVVIAFTKGYREPEIDCPKGKKKKKETKWSAFLCHV
jgi:hypothetical protein